MKDIKEEMSKPDKVYIKEHNFQQILLFFAKPLALWHFENFYLQKTTKKETAFFDDIDEFRDPVSE